MTIAELVEYIRIIRKRREAEGEVLNKDWAVLKMTEEMGEIATDHILLTGRAKTDLGTDELKDRLACNLADMLSFIMDIVGTNNLDLEAAIRKKWRLDKNG